MALPIEIHPEAIKEARAAREWYQVRDASAADGSMLETDRAITQIIDFPDRWPTYLQGTRRFLLHRYPFQSFIASIQVALSFLPSPMRAGDRAIG